MGHALWVQKYGNDWPKMQFQYRRTKLFKKLELFPKRMIPDVTKMNSYIRIHAYIFFPVLRCSDIIYFFFHQLRVEIFLPCIKVTNNEKCSGFKFISFTEGTSYGY